MFIMAKQNEGPVGVCIGKFQHPEHEESRSVVVHGVKKYGQTLGDWELWHDSTFAFIGDVVEGDIQMVALTQDMFHRTREPASTQIYGTAAEVDQVCTNHPDKELLGPVDATEPGSAAIRTRHLMPPHPRNTYLL
jgi:hypothetical protein